MSQIILEGVSKLYGDKPALREVSHAFEDNLTTAVIGPSGSGKSTLLQLINGLLRPGEGSIHVFGRPLDYKRLTEIRLQMGYAVQGTGLFPHMTVQENITLLARLQGWERSRLLQRTEQLMSLVNLPGDLIRRYPHELSGGQRQRVGLCRAMMLDPPIFLLDEPFGALDPITRSEVQNEFLHLQQVRARTTVLVTHDLREALRLAQQIIILRRGRVVQVGTPEVIRTRPSEEFVRKFVQSQLED
jgi:osmoprotectant transport system ATP-binding protein